MDPKGPQGKPKTTETQTKDNQRQTPKSINNTPTHSDSGVRGGPTNAHLNISFNFVEGESLMMGMSSVAVSSGSACTSATLEPSHVMRALGVGEDLVHTSIRFSLGRFTTDEDVEHASSECLRSARKLRDMSPLWEMFKEGIVLSCILWKHD